MFCPYIILILAERTRQTKYKVRGEKQREHGTGSNKTSDRTVEEVPNLKGCFFLAVACFTSQLLFLFPSDSCGFPELWFCM